jgi:hypothetical protein
MRIVVPILMLLLIGFASGGCADNNSSLPPEEDAFVRYCQAVQSLAAGLKSLKSAAEYNNPNATPGLERARDGIEKARDEVITFRDAVQELPGETRRQLRTKHSDLVARTAAACRALKDWHKAHPEILGKDWDQYWGALQFGEVLGPSP